MTLPRVATTPYKMAVKLESDPEKAATLLLFTNVENAAEIREAAVSGKIQAAVLDPTIVRFNSYCTFHHILWSVHKNF